MRRRPEYSTTALLVYMASAIAVLGTAAMSPVLPAILTEFGLTETEVSLMMSLFTLPIVFFVPIVGLVADRVGRRPVLGFCLLLFGVSGTAIYFAPSFEVILGLRVLQGIGFSGIIPLAVVVIGDLFDGADEVGAQGMRVMFVNLGAAAFPVATGFLVERSWNTPFLLFAIAVPAGLIVLRWIPEPKTDEELPRRYSRALLSAIRQRLVAASLLVGPLRFFLLYGIYTFLPVLVVRNDLTIGRAGVIIGAINVAKMVVASQSRWSLRFGTPQRTMVVGMLLATGLLGLFAVADTFLAFLLVAVSFGAADGLTAPLQKSVLTQNISMEIRAGMISVNAVLQNIAKTVAPISLGLVIGIIGIEYVFVVAGGAGAVVAVVAIFLAMGQLSPEPMSEPARDD